MSGLEVTFVLVTSGSPCQGLSGANATRAGFADPRSKLFFHSTRIIKELHQEKHIVHYMNENVASMKDQDRATFTHHMGVRPIRADAGQMSQARRDRYYWCSWNISQKLGVTVVSREHYYQVSFAAVLPPATEWADPGWICCGEPDTKLPMRA